MTIKAIKPQNLCFTDQFLLFCIFITPSFCHSYKMSYRPSVKWQYFIINMMLVSKGFLTLVS